MLLSPRQHNKIRFEIPASQTSLLLGFAPFRTAPLCETSARSQAPVAQDDTPWGYKMKPVKSGRAMQAPALHDSRVIKQNSLPAFLFDARGTKRKANKREMPRLVSPPAGGDQRSTALDSCRLLKKAGENFSNTLAVK